MRLIRALWGSSGSGLPGDAPDLKLVASRRRNSCRLPGSQLKSPIPTTCREESRGVDIRVKHRPADAVSTLTIGMVRRRACIQSVLVGVELDHEL